MSIIKVSTRGNSIQWTATFKDFDGAVTSPGAATLHLVFEGGTASVVMFADTAGDWTGEWDSSVAEPGVVYWSIRATGPSIASDGQITLSANSANPEPA